MTDSCEEFREYLIKVKKSSSNTVESYIRDVSQYFSYCASSPADGLWAGQQRKLSAAGKSGGTASCVPDDLE